jgi:hypothetical protein
MINWLRNILKELFFAKDKNRKKQTDFFFERITVLPTIPENSQLRKGDFITVVHNAKSYWAIFKCPCGCSEIISLPLQSTHNPHWNVSQSKNGRPSLQPSVWQNKGCLSHFWIEDGNVNWCKNSGIEPWVAEPRYYNAPSLYKKLS